VSLLEAVANAGGLSELANRSKINLIRQYPEGYKVHLIDLTSASVFESPYFYLQPNDMVYVEPLKIRSFGRSTTGIEAFRDVVSLFSGIAAISANVFLIMNFNR
jgi:polysaccharide export outer membrane protein